MKSLYHKIAETVNLFENEAVNLLQELVRIPSENFPPFGNEKQVQEFYHAWLRKRGIESYLCLPDEITEFAEHPARLAEYDMRGRPNVIANFKGTGTGRSLLLLAHSDVVPAGDRELWNDDPFSGRISDGRLYGRGSGDDKCGMAIMALLPLILKSAGIELTGDLTIASVADEEYGGGNGTAALLASGIKADAALYLDGSNQMIWNTGLGGGFVEVEIETNHFAELDEYISYLEKVIGGIKDDRKKAIIEHKNFGFGFFAREMEGFYKINIEKTDKGKARLSFFLDTLPGEDEEVLKRVVEDRLMSNEKCRVAWMSRFLKPAAEISPLDPFLITLAESFQQATGRQAEIGPGRQSDQGLISYFGDIPCLVFGCGRRGKEGAPHLPNEYIILKDFRENLFTAVLMAVNWCGRTKEPEQALKMEYDFIGVS